MSSRGSRALEGAAMRVVVNPDRGCEILHVGAPGGPNVLFHNAWRTPLPAGSPGSSVSYGASDLDWLSHYRGGWQELFPNAGAACDVAGVPLAFHGEASSARWQVTEESATSLVAATATRLPLVLERRMEVDPERPVLRLRESIGNESGLPMPYVWGHHPAFDAVPGSRIDLPGAIVEVPEDFDPAHNDLRPGTTAPWPLVEGKDGSAIDLRLVPDAPRERVAYLTDVTAGWVALRQPGGVGVALSWDTATFPHLWCWTEIGGADFPWFGRSRIVALEPMSSWPNDGLARAIERGRAGRLDAGARADTWLTLSLFDADERPVTGVGPDGDVRRDDA